MGFIGKKFQLWEECALCFLKVTPEAIGIGLSHCCLNHNDIYRNEGSLANKLPAFGPGFGCIWVARSFGQTVQDLRSTIV
jgi:hypothetical protein